MRFLILLALTLILNVSLEADDNLDSSRSFYKVAYNRDKKEERDSFEKARILYNEARFNQAIRTYQEIIKADPHNIKAFLNLAYLYKDLAEYKQAIATVKEALDFSDDIQLRMLLGQLYYLDGNPEQAIIKLRQFLPFYSESPEFLLYLGMSYEGIGELIEAEAFYNKFIGFKPNSVLAYLKLGNIYYQKQEFKQAMRAYQKVISLDPSIPKVRPKLAECFTKLGKTTEAYKQYAKSVAINPSDKLLQERLDEAKAKLGDDFFKRQKTQILKYRRKKSIKVTASALGKISPRVRVGVASINGSIEFKCGSPFEIIDKRSNNILFKGRKESFYSLVFNKKTVIQLKDYQGNVLLEGLNRPFLIRNKSGNSVISIFDIPVGKGNFWAGWSDQQYRGIIEVIPDSNGFQLINLINLEEYLYGVLPSEMSADWPKQALRAQAIAARTWAVKNIARHKHQGFNFCSSVHCQAYKGVGVETELTNQAVDDTAGLVAVLDNQPVDIFYANNCGGCTRDGVVDSLTLNFNFYPSPLELEEWLKGEPDVFCNLEATRLANFRWKRLYAQEQLQAMLDKFNIDIGEPMKVIPQTRARSGHLISIKIQGTEANQIIEGENNIRKTLGNLLSSAFKIETRFNQEGHPVEYIFYGGGFGHGRGLCQVGMKGMALGGYDYLKILEHYYPETKIKKIY
jgi:SpoIID/LytB domain protein